MRITRLELFHICIPFAKPYPLSRMYGTLNDAQAVIFKVHTDEGIVGLGEADPMNPFTEETPGSVMAVSNEIIARHLLGQDPTRVAVLERTLDHFVHGNLLARGAVNMALYDILGKVHNLPAHHFLGGQLHSELPILWGVGSGTPAEDAADIEALMDRGCRTVMLKMGASSPGDEIERMISARKRFGDELFIVTDANQGWEMEEALAFVQGVRGQGPDLIEQPVKYWDFSGLRRIRMMASCPLSADESLVTIQDAARLITERAVDVFSIKVSKNGGLTKSRQIAQTGEAFGIKCLMNSMLEFGVTQAASLQLGCTLPNLLAAGHAYGSVARMSDDVTDFGNNLSHRSTVNVPKGSGLGIALNEEKLKKFTRGYLEIKGN